MVLSPPSKPDLCRTALNMCGVAGALCILSLGTKTFPFNILFVKIEKWLCSCRMQPGCLGPTVSQNTTQRSVPSMKTLSLFYFGHGEQTLPSLQSVRLVWIAFFPVFEGFLSCLCSQKCRIHGARRRKQEAAKAAAWEPEYSPGTAKSEFTIKSR